MMRELLENLALFAIVIVCFYIIVVLVGASGTYE